MYSGCSRLRVKIGSFWGHLFAAQCASGWVVGLVKNLPTNLCLAGHINKRGLYRINQYKPRTNANLPYQPCPHILLRQPPRLPMRVGAAGKKQWEPVKSTSGYGSGYSRISSKSIIPELPGCGLFLSPKPMEIVLTLVRFTPPSLNCFRLISHCVQSPICVAPGSS